MSRDRDEKKADPTTAAETITPAQTIGTSTADPVGDAVRLLSARRTELLATVGEIETFLGFATSAEDLAVRVAKLELFTGITRK